MTDSQTGEQNHNKMIESFIVQYEHQTIVLRIAEIYFRVSSLSPMALCSVVQEGSPVRLFMTLLTVALQTPQSVGFSRVEY